MFASAKTAFIFNETILFDAFSVRLEKLQFLEMLTGSRDENDDKKTAKKKREKGRKRTKNSAAFSSGK